MNSKQTLAVLAGAALCGFALAQTPKNPSPADRLDALEKEVMTLRARIDALPPSTSDELQALRKALVETRGLVNQLVAWTAVQAQNGAELLRVLDEAEAKGFTYGINPESREVLLGGWRELAAGFQKDVPKLAAAADSSAKPAPQDGKSPARADR